MWLPTLKNIYILKLFLSMFCQKKFGFESILARFSTHHFTKYLSLLYTVIVCIGSTTEVTGTALQKVKQTAYTRRIQKISKTNHLIQSYSLTSYQNNQH